MTFQQDEISHADPKNVGEYAPTPYVEEVWQKIDEVKLEESFCPDEYDRVVSKEYAVDPMFCDFDREPPSNPQSFAAGSTESSVTEERAESAGEVAEPFEKPSINEASEQSSSTELATADSAVIEEVVESVASVAELASQETAVEPEPVDENEADLSLSQDVSTQEPSGEEAVASSLHVEGAQPVADPSVGIEEARAAFEQRFNSVVEDMQTQVAEAIHMHERSAVELALQVARKLVGEVVQGHSEYVLQIISEALKSVGGSEITTIRVSPQDFEFLQLEKNAAIVKRQGPGDWKFESDDSIRAGCIISTSAGDLDFDLDKAWARLREKVLKGPKAS